MTHNPTPRKRATEVIACLVNGLSQVKTATELGSSRETVGRIARENKELIDQQKSEQSRLVAAELWDRALYAARRLEELMDSPNDAVAISAVRIALAEGLRWFDAVEMEQRLAVVEERLALRAVS